MHVLAAVRVNVWQPGAGHSLHIQHARCWHTARSPLAVNNTLLHSWTVTAKKKSKTPEEVFCVSFSSPSLSRTCRALRHRDTKAQS